MSEKKARPVAWMVDAPDEPELGHWFVEEPCGERCRHRPLVLAPTDEEIAAASRSIAHLLMSDVRKVDTDIIESHIRELLAPKEAA